MSSWQQHLQVCEGTFGRQQHLLLVLGEEHLSCPDPAVPSSFKDEKPEGEEAGEVVGATPLPLLVSLAKRILNAKVY